MGVGGQTIGLGVGGKMMGVGEGGIARGVGTGWGVTVGLGVAGAAGVAVGRGVRKMIGVAVGICASASPTPSAIRRSNSCSDGPQARENSANPIANPKLSRLKNPPAINLCCTVPVQQRFLPSKDALLSPSTSVV